MTPTRLRLVDADRELVLFGDRPRRLDLVVQNLDVGSPTVRAVTEARTNADGEYDTTRHHGPRAVSLELQVFDHPAALVDQLNGFLHPARRPYLCLTDDEWGGERRLRLRADQFGAPIPVPGFGLSRTVQLQWQAPSGVWEATDPVSFELSGEAEHSVGRVYPEVFPRVYPASVGTGQAVHVNPGSTWSDQVVRMYGPCRGPRYSNDDTGETFVFSEELTIGLGDYVEVDTANHTAFYLSDPAASRLGFLDWSRSSWWQLPPGPTKVRYHPVSEVGAGCGSVTTYRPAWL